MSSVHFQFKSILHSYETDTSLVYSNTDDCFYSVGSISRLNKKDYEINPQSVQRKVQDFVVNNQHVIHRDNLSTFSAILEKRVESILACTTGILALFYYFFNSSSKDRLLTNKCLMEDLKHTIDDAIEQLKMIREEEIEPETHLLTSPPPTSPLKTQSSTFFGSPLSQKTLDTPLSPPNKSQTSIASPLLPPPPPPLPKFNLNAYTLPQEPPALTFDPLHYKKLSDDKVTQQTALIGTYIQKLQDALEPIRDQVKLTKEIPIHLKELKNELQDVSSQLNRCEENLARLKEGDEKAEIILLAYKSGEKYIQLPYFPDQIHEAIQERHKELEDANKTRKTELETQISTQKQFLDQKKQKLSEETDEELEIEIEKTQQELKEAEDELKQVLSKPSFDKRLLYPSLKFSDAIAKFDEVIAQLQERQESIQTDCHNLEKKLDELEQFRYHNLNLTELEKIVTSKVKLIDKWERYKNSREQWLKQRLKQKSDGKGIYKAPRKERKEPLQPEIVKEYPVLQYLLNLPQQILVLLRGNNLREGDIVDTFKSSIYAQLYANIDTKNQKS